MDARMKAWQRGVAFSMCLVASCVGPAKTTEAPPAHAGSSPPSVADVGAPASPAIVPEATTEAIPTFPYFLRIVSPLSRAADITVPVFLFHSKADDNVPTTRIARFAAALRQHHCPLTLEEVERGDHYESMIDPGIARALLWLAKTYPPAGAAPPPRVSARVRIPLK